MILLGSGWGVPGSVLAALGPEGVGHLVLLDSQPDAVWGLDTSAVPPDVLRRLEAAGYLRRLDGKWFLCPGGNGFPERCEVIDATPTRSFGSGKKSATYRRLAERDGSNCSYCGVALALTEDDVVWRPGTRYWGHCGCGEHDPEREPCDLRGGWGSVEGKRWPSASRVVPKALGGKDEDSNLVLACWDCAVTEGSKRAVAAKREMSA